MKNLSVKALCLGIVVIQSLMLPSAEGFFRRSRKPAGGGGADATILRRIQEIEDQRQAGDKFLVNQLTNPNRRIAKAAILAMGRIGDTSGLEEMAKILNRKDKELKADTAFALGLIGGDVALRLLTQHSQMYKDAEIVGPILVAVGRAGNESSVNFFANFLREGQDPKLYEPAAHGLGLLWSGPTEKWAVTPGLLSRLIKVSQTSDSASLSAAFALSRYKGDASQIPADELIQAVTRAQLVYARAFLVRALGKIKSANAAAVLARELSTSPYLGVRVEAAKALAAQEATDPVLSALSGSLSNANAGVVVTALESIANFGLPAAKLSDAVNQLIKPNTSAWIKATAIKTLARISPALGRTRVMENIASPSPLLAAAAVHALGTLGSASDLDRLATFITSADYHLAEEAIESVSSLPEASFTPSIRMAMKKALERADVGVTTLVAQLAEKLKWKDFAQPLATVYRLFTQRDQIEAKVAVLSALAFIGDYSNVELLNFALTDPDRIVVVAAANAIKAITGKDESARIPLNSRNSVPTPPAKDVAASLHNKVVIKTSRGELHLEMLEEAPLTVHNFIRLAKQGFYNGKTFHRVVPNFVAQGGDPRADGYGGPAYLIRDEFSPLRHSRGTIGMATAGKDTGGCQFFINLSPNPHLDGRYTLFAEVTKGIDVADKLEVGDQILSIKVY